MKCSLLTGKYILFGTSDEGDQLIETEFPSDDNIDVNSVGVMSLDKQINLCQQEMNDDCFLSSVEDDIINID